MHFQKIRELLGLILILLNGIPPSSNGSPLEKPEPRSGNQSRLSPRHKRTYSEICHAGKIYNVTSVDYLKENLVDLQCIFRAAEEPSKVPVGPLYGDVLIAANTRFFNPLVRLFWKGKFIEKVKCQQNETWLGWNKMIRQPHVPFVAYLGKMTDHLNPHPLYRDNKTSLMIDYLQDMLTVCPDYVKMKGRNFETLPIRKSPVNKKFYPLNIFLDVLRFVGRQEDGGAILLGQLFVMDKFAKDKQSKPICFFTVVSYDPELNKQFVHGQPLRALDSDFHYKNQNILESLMIIFPLDNMLSEPIHAVKMMASEVIPAGRSLKNVIWDACCGDEGDSARLKAEFTAFENNITTSKMSSKSNFISKHEDFHSHFNEL